MATASLVLLTSCLNSNDAEVTLYDDAVITAFTLGTLTQTVTTTENGTATTTSKQFSGSNYAFSIDQLNRRIFNQDSLPKGTDVSNLLCTITTRNNGYVLLRDTLTTDLYVYSSSAGINFNQPRIFEVYSTDNTTRSIYEISVNVHQQDGDEFRWQLVSTSWTEPATGALPAGISKLIGSSTNEQYGLDASGRLMVLYKDSTEWRADPFDEAADMLPAEDISIVSYPMAYSDSTEYVLMVGNRSAADHPGDATAVVWRKIVDLVHDADKGVWAYVERDSSDIYQLPRMENLSIIRYDGAVYALGAPYTSIYQSRDNGITWKKNALFTLPDGFDSTATKVTMATDDDNYIYLYCAGTGQVWRGRPNRMGWQ